LHYQPQIDIKSGKLAGVEALVRWEHPDHGLVYPDMFIPMAEKNGLIGDLTEQIIKQAVLQSLSWKEMNFMVQVSVNISAENITSLKLPEQLRIMLDDNKLDPSMLTLEVTESALMGELVTSLDILTRLRMKGIELSIDDFGTGYSSLSQLYRVPFTELKVDQSFVMRMRFDEEAKGIVIGVRHSVESEQKISHDGRELIYNSIKFPLFNKEGVIYAVCGISTNVTEKKKSEKALALSFKEWSYAMDFFEDAIYLVDLNDQLMRANRSFYNLTGLTPDNAIGQDITSIIHPEGEDVPCPVCKARHDRRDEVIEMESDHPDNPTGRPIRVKIQIIRDQLGNALSILMGIHDLTEEQAKEEESERLQHQLHQSQKMDALGKLTGGIAHDFNNMLGVVTGYAELLELALKEKPTLSKYAHEIHHAGLRGAKLTKKLLSFSRQKAFEEEEININDLIRSEKHLLEKTLTARINLILDLEKNIWPIWIDVGDLEDAILNMSINSMHSMENSGKLIIQSRNKNINLIGAKLLGLEEGDYVLLSITDTGCGMDNEIKDSIFDPFFTTKGSKGTGLGLSQVYGFVERSGGGIKVYSVVGEGTQFKIYFPRYYGEKNQKDIIHAPSLKHVDGIETILIVDDEIGLLKLTSELLRKHGYNVICAESAQQALNELENVPVDLLLSDVIMPAMDGYELASIVQKKYPDIKIQLASGFTDDRQSDDEHLQKNLLQKPYDLKVLLQNIRGLLGGNESVINTPVIKSSNLTTTSNLNLIEWTDELSVGINQIDEDHKVLISLVNRCLISLNNEDQGELEIKNILDELLSYTKYHFQREELMMDVCEYPNTSKHKQVHKLLISEVERYVREFEQKKLTLEGLLEFITSWLINHIMGMDKAIGPYCEDKVDLIEDQLEKAKLNK
jgi:hemerythrin-like metal-binding protein/PAS domain S-box-containing protein